MTDSAWQVHETRGEGALDAVLRDWRELETRCSDATPFQSPEWLLPWWHCFHHGELRVVTVRRNGVLHALVPYLLERAYPVHRLTVLGTGNTDYLDPLVSDEARDSAGALALACAVRSLGDEDYCEFEQLRSGSPLLTVPAPASWHWEAGQCDVCPVLLLPPTEGDLSGVVPGHFLAKLRYARRHLERAGPVRVDRAGPDNLAELLGALFALHQARWKARGEAGVLREDAVRRFHRAVAAGALARGALRLYALRVADRVVAVFYGFAWRGRTYYYLGAFDPAFASYSVGALLVEHAVRQAVREGASEFDFLRGAEPYKYRWGAQDRPVHRRVLRRDVA